MTTLANNKRQNKIIKEIVSDVKFQVASLEHVLKISYSLDSSIFIDEIIKKLIELKRVL